MVAESLMLSLDGLRAIDTDTAPSGALVYILRVKQFATFAEGDGERFLLDLGGDRPMGVWAGEVDLGACVVIPDWRIEVDPTSATDAEYDQLSSGQAFIRGDDIGLVGLRQPQRRVTIAISTTGQASRANGVATGRIGFAKWRIVAGPAERPYVVTTSELCDPNKPLS